MSLAIDKVPWRDTVQAPQNVPYMPLEFYMISNLG